MIKKKYNLNWKYQCPDCIMTLSVLKFPQKSYLIFGGHDKFLYFLDENLKIPYKMDLKGWCRCTFPVDLDFDGNDELLIGTGDGKFIVIKLDLINNKLTKIIEYKSNRKITCCTAGDLNGDGNKELIFGSEDKSVKIYNNIESEEPLLTLFYDSWIRNCLLGFFKTSINSKLIYGLLVGSKNGTIQLSEIKTGKQEIIWERNICSIINTLKIGDINNDGYNEIIVATADNSIKIFNGEGEKIKDLNLKENNPLSLLIADINGDNINEIIAGCSDGSLKVFQYLSMKSFDFILNWESKISSSSVMDISYTLDNEKKKSYIILGGYEGIIYNITDFEWDQKPKSNIVPKVIGENEKLIAKIGNEILEIEKLIEAKSYFEAIEKLNKIKVLTEYSRNDDLIKNIKRKILFCENLAKQDKIIEILNFEYNNKREIEKLDLIRNFNFTISEADYFYRILNEKIDYCKEEEKLISIEAEKALRTLKSLSLFDLIEIMNYDLIIAKKIGKYLLDNQIILEFPKFPKEYVEEVKQERMVTTNQLKDDFELKYIQIARGGDWKIEGDQSIFYYKVKVMNKSKFIISNIQIFLTSIPSGLEPLSDKYKIEILRPDSNESPTFKLRAKKSCIGDIIESLITFNDPMGNLKTIQVPLFEIKYVCNLLVPKEVSKHEFDKNTILMKDQKIIMDCDKSTKEIEAMLIKILQHNNFYVLPPSQDSHQLRFVEMEGYAHGKYDKKDVALSIIVQELEEKKQLIIKAMSDEVAKLVDILREISSQCDDIKSDTEFIKEYIPLIEDIFEKLEKLDEIEIYLREHLASDWEKIKESWKAYKEGKIKRKDLIWEIFKIGGKKVIKKLIEKYI